MSEVPRVRVFQPEGGRRLVKQSFAEQQDINNIVARHVAHRVPLPDPPNSLTYGDFSGYDSYHSAYNAVIDAQEEFMRLPSKVRTHCRNDVGTFLDMVQDDEQRAALLELGLDPAFVPSRATEVASSPAVGDPEPS